MRPGSCGDCGGCTVTDETTPLSDAERVVGSVVDAVSAAAPLVAPLAGPYAPLAVLIARGIKGLWSLAEQWGHADAVRTLLDSELAAGRAATDEALRKKREHDT